MADLAALPLAVPEILLPAAGVDLSRWAVVACDQYTSQRDYWQALEAHVGAAPSALRLIFPEVYLPDGDEAARIAAIHARMREYLERGTLAPPRRGFVLVERETARGARRRGLIAALDLEHYDFRDGSRTQVRATERTVEERLPARVRVREGAALELPHVMVLVDDPQRSLIEPLAERAAGRAPLYDTPLWPDSGRVRGWLADAPADVEHVLRSLGALADPQAYRQRYSVANDDVLLFAVGDGNHSLAAARLLWERLRPRLTETQAASHPARWALVELVNLHDAGLVFEPIHRVVFDADPAALLATLPGWLAGHGSRGRIERLDDPQRLEQRLHAAWSAPARSSDSQLIGWTDATHCGLIEVERPRATLPVATLQTFLDACLEKHSGAAIDYIHGAEVVRKLCSTPRRLGFFLPALDKRDLFRSVILDGALPRKTFSLGEADEKRFYLEARRILPDEPRAR
jgi:hypothetical protein